MTYRGRPVLGAIAGLLFGLFLAVDLIMGNAVSSGTNLVLVLPAAGVVVGIALALWAPFRWRARPAGVPTTVGPAGPVEAVGGAERAGATVAPVGATPVEGVEVADAGAGPVMAPGAGPVMAPGTTEPGASPAAAAPEVTETGANPAAAAPEATEPGAAPDA